MNPLEYLVFGIAILPLLAVVLLLPTKRYFSGFAYFFLFYLMIYVLRGGVILFGAEPLTRQDLVREPDEWLAAKAMLIAGFAYSCALAGYLVLRNRKVLPRVPFLAVKVLPSSAWWVFLGIAAVNAVLILIAFGQAGGNPARLIYLGRNRELFGGSFFITAIPHKSLYLGIFGLYMARFGETRFLKRLKLSSVAVILASALVLLLMGERAELVLPWIALLMANYAGGTSKLRLGRLVLIGMVLVVGSTFFGRARKELSRAGRSEVQTRQVDLANWGAGHSAIQLITAGVNANTFDHFAILTQDFGHWGDLEGLHFVRRAQGLIPRRWWPDKPEIINPGGWFADRYYGDVRGMPFGVVGVWWLNWGVLVLGLAFFCTGALFKLCDNTIFAGNTPPVHKFIVVYFMVQIINKGIDPSIVQALIMNMVPFVAAVWLMISTGTAFRRPQSGVAEA